MSVRTLNIVSCQAVHQGESNGRPWTLYEVAATNEHGEAIDVPLRSFAELTLGAGSFHIEKRDYNGETQYTLKPAGAPASAGARLGPKVDDLRERVERLERALAELRAGQTPAEPSSYGEQGAYRNAIFGDDDGATF